MDSLNSVLLINATLVVATSAGAAITLLLNKRSRRVVYQRLDRLEDIATDNSLREIEERPEVVRLNFALDGETILSLYNQTLTAGNVPVSTELEEAAQSDASVRLSLGRFTPGYGRKRTSTQRTSFKPENEPVRAVLAVERQLQESRSIRTIDLTSSIDDRPVSNMLKDIERRALRIGLEVPEGVGEALRNAWEARNRKLTDESIATLTGFVKVRADFTISASDSGDLLIEAHWNGASQTSVLSIVCRQEHILARTVLVPGETVRATCFGSVTRWDEKRRTLGILPISVYA